MMLALLTVLLATTGTPTCSEPPQAFIDVVGTHGPVSVETDFGLADLQKLAADSGRPIHHPPLGFYYGQFSYILKIAIGASAATVCNDPVHITVVMGLTN